MTTPSRSGGRTQQGTQGSVTTNQQGGTYVLQKAAPSGRASGSGAGGQAGSGSQTPRSRTGTALDIGSGAPVGKHNVIAGLPRWLQEERILLAAWFIAMIIIGFDEWHNFHILPRPARLWFTSLTFGILALAGISETVRPLTNALAIGFVFVLLWQYYNNTGQFAATGG